MIRRLYFLSCQFGIDPRKILYSLRGLPRYLRDLVRFRYKYTGRFKLSPCLYDWYEEGGTTKSEYFWQDLLVARKIFAANPERHVDVGSRVDGFVAHVASFRQIEVFDIRPTSTHVPNVIFRQVDIMRPVDDPGCDSLSCLHALEHFGLGRYGDPIDSRGFEKGFANMAVLVRPGGTFYLSVPIGIDRVEFNAHRVFDPCVVVRLAAEHALQLSGLMLIRQGGQLEELAVDKVKFDDLGSQQYMLGIFTFSKCN